jgi:tRNA (adenine57-N1/adenine58-N1)-methyltransferase
LNVAQEDDLVLLIGRDNKRFLIRLQAGSQLQTHRGVIQHDDLIGQPLGREIRSHLHYPFVVLQPSTHDLIRDIKRITQIVYPKDAGYILLKLSVRDGSRVIEAGTGSGGLTLALAQAVMPTGRVYSYESRPEMMRLAMRNLARVGLDDYVEFKEQDVVSGFAESEVDALFLDMRRPWDYLAQAWEALKGGGFFGSILPTTNQVSELLRGLESPPFADVEVEELLLRRYKTVPDRLRPVDRMVAHTGYLIFARKILPPPPDEPDTSDDK